MRRLGAASMVALVAFALIAMTSASYAGDATIYAVHGIPDLAVDVSVDGDCVAENVMYGAIILIVGFVIYGFMTHNSEEFGRTVVLMILILSTS